MTLKLQEAFLAFVAEKKASPAFAAWTKAQGKKASPAAARHSARASAPAQELARSPSLSLARSSQGKTHNLHLAYAMELRKKDEAGYKAWEKKFLEAKAV